jgi:hypothetical protein
MPGPRSNPNAIEPTWYPTAPAPVNSESIAPPAAMTPAKPSQDLVPPRMRPRPPTRPKIKPPQAARLWPSMQGPSSSSLDAALRIPAPKPKAIPATLARATSAPTPVTNARAPMVIPMATLCVETKCPTECSTPQAQLGQHRPVARGSSIGMASRPSAKTSPPEWKAWLTLLVSGIRTEG